VLVYKVLEYSTSSIAQLFASCWEWLAESLEKPHRETSYIAGGGFFCPTS